MAKRIRMFFAYPSEPASLGDTIESFARDTKKRSNIPNELRVQTWKDSPVSGNRLASSIMSRIRRSEIFACDLTFFNYNVAFELGFAIGTFKRLFITLDTSVEGSERSFKTSYFKLLGIGYAGYRNQDELSDKLEYEAPWRSLSHTILGPQYGNERSRPENPTLFYVKPTFDPPQALHTLEAIDRSVFSRSLVVDDPNDNPAPKPEWYAERLAIADAVIIQLLSANHVDHLEHNVKASLVAGMAAGLGRKVLMLAQSPFETPVDYSDLLQVDERPTVSGPKVKTWLDAIERQLPQRRPRRLREPNVNALELRHVALGEPVAEHERDDLDAYFVETPSYFRALDAPTTIMIGRRGTGKTAILHAIRAQLEHSRDDHVAVLDPVGYELEGLIRILNEIRENSERGFLIESLWKYLIYSEIAKSVEDSILTRSAYEARNEDEEQFLWFCETNAETIRSPFSARLEHAVSSLEGVGSLDRATEQRAKISEGLHEKMIGTLRRQIGLALGRSKKLTVLIDNLDAPWRPGANTEELTELISGLLHVVQDIPHDFERKDRGLSPVTTSLTVLLRSDIFAFVQPMVSEQDKLPLERLAWNDSEQLGQVISRRLLRFAPAGISADQAWATLFAREVMGVSPQDFILRSILPRPRDAIYFVRDAVDNAINRGHQRVEQQDLLDARIQYSDFAFRSLLAEDDPSRRRLEEVLFEFAGVPKIVDRETVEAAMGRASLTGDDAEYYINLLCDIGFLGIGTNHGYEYPNDENRRVMLRRVAHNIASSRSETETFEINPAFYTVLQIDE